MRGTHRATASRCSALRAWLRYALHGAVQHGSPAHFFDTGRSIPRRTPVDRAARLNLLPSELVLTDTSGCSEHGCSEHGCPAASPRRRALFPNSDNDGATEGQPEVSLKKLDDSHLRTGIRSGAGWVRKRGRRARRVHRAARRSRARCSRAQCFGARCSRTQRSRTQHYSAWGSALVGDRCDAFGIGGVQQRARRDDHSSGAIAEPSPGRDRVERAAAHHHSHLALALRLAEPIGLAVGDCRGAAAALRGAAGDRAPW